LKLLIYRLDLRQRDRLLQAAGEKGMQHTWRCDCSSETEETECCRRWRMLAGGIFDPKQGREKLVWLDVISQLFRIISPLASHRIQCYASPLCHITSRTLVLICNIDTSTGLMLCSHRTLTSFHVSQQTNISS
jgi:hypothetical protein